MKTLHYNVYRQGMAGLSNLVMSVELGVILAALTDRVLVLKGNVTPPANVVQYGDRVRNAQPSRVTDLIDLGVPWIDANDRLIAGSVPQEVCEHDVWDCVFYYPPTLSMESEDAEAFAGKRNTFLTIPDELEHLPALSFSGGTASNTLSFYSFLFYLDRAAQTTAYDALFNMRPKPPYAALAERVAADIGTFNSVHIRRGDFKKTIGTTTLDRTPEEAIAAMDQCFDRYTTLVVLTDEADDPFFEPIRSTYPNLLFIDEHILDEYGIAFADLPMRDSIALAYLSQLVAARSQDFIGTMTSTFTGLIQRMRGNLGKDEPFKYLWNEIVPAGAKVERGRHTKGDDVRLDHCVMVEEFDGPYSWNRHTQLISQAWMREWPEAFLDQGAMLERAGRRVYKSTAENALSPLVATPKPAAIDVFKIGFLGKTVLARSEDPKNHAEFSQMFEAMQTKGKGKPLSRVELRGQQSVAKLFVDDKPAGPENPGSKLVRHAYREVVRSFIHQNSELVWLHAGAAALDNRTIIFCAPWGHGKSTLTLDLYNRGWSMLSDDIVPIDPVAGTAIAFPATPQMRTGPRSNLMRSQVSTLPKTVVPLDPARIAAAPQSVSMFVFPRYSKAKDPLLRSISPAQCAGKVLENCLSFPKNSDDVIQKLCDLVEGTPAYELHFSSAPAATDLLIETLGTFSVSGKPELVG